MDFSQLPKMSDTPKPAAPEPSPTASRPVDYATPDGAMGFGIASVWISLVLGLIFMMLGANFGRWLLATLSGKEFPTGWLQADGVTPVRYFELQGGTAWSDAGLFLMGVALLIDAALMLLYYRSGRPSFLVIWSAILFMGVALAINLFVAVRLFSMNVMPLLTMGALLVGGMMLFDHLPMARRSPTRGVST